MNRRTFVTSSLGAAVAAVIPHETVACKERRKLLRERLQVRSCRSILENSDVKPVEDAVWAYQPVRRPDAPPNIPVSTWHGPRYPGTVKHRGAGDIEEFRYLAYSGGAGGWESFWRMVQYSEDTNITCPDFLPGHHARNHSRIYLGVYNVTRRTGTWVQVITDLQGGNPPYGNFSKVRFPDGKELPKVGGLRSWVFVHFRFPGFYMDAKYADDDNRSKPGTMWEWGGVYRQ